MSPASTACWRAATPRLSTVRARLRSWLHSFPPVPIHRVPYHGSRRRTRRRAVPGAGVLAVLAHELGHVLLADVNADGTGGMGISVANEHPRSLLCSKPAIDCFEHAFLEATSTPTRWNAKNFHDNI